MHIFRGDSGFLSVVSKQINKIARSQICRPMTEVDKHVQYTSKTIVDADVGDEGTSSKVPSVAEWVKAPESDASTGSESPVRAPVRAATLCPYV